jgi:hypothetical protein
VLLWVFTELNIFVLVGDFIDHRNGPNKAFLTALLIRAILMPVFAFFHPAIGWLHAIKSSLLRWLLRGASLLAVA